LAIGKAIKNFSVIKSVSKAHSLPSGLYLFFIFISSFFFIECQIRPLGQKELSPGDQIREQILKDARALIGADYKYAGKKPKTGFDCSGFTHYVFRQSGIELGASSSLQSKQGKYREADEARPGDLVFFGPPFQIDHVGIVTQNKKGKLYVIHSTNSQGVVEHDVFQILYWKRRLKFARDVISP